MPNSSKKRTYPDVLMTCPLVARQAVGSIEPDPHVMQGRTRPAPLPDNAVLIVQAASGSRGARRRLGCTCDSATNANLPQRHARCQGRRSLEWVTARPEVASAARTHAHQPTAAPGSPSPSAGATLSTRLRIMNWEEGRAGKRGPCPLLLGLKRRQTRGGVQSMQRPDHRTTRRSL
jgi:hypothetical protein